MIVKLMDRNGNTRNNYHWSDGTRHAADNQTDPMELCSDTVIHFYADEMLAVLMNPAHGSFSPAIARRFEPEGDVISDGTKSGCRVGTTRELVDLPPVSHNQRIRFAILCALQVYSEPGFIKWASNWLDGNNRTQSAAAAAVAYSAAAAAAAGGVYSATAYSAAAAAEDAAGGVGVYPSATAAAARSKSNIDFIAIAHQAINEENQFEEKQK